MDPDFQMLFEQVEALFKGIFWPLIGRDKYITVSFFDTDTVDVTK